MYVQSSVMPTELSSMYARTKIVFLRRRVATIGEKSDRGQIFSTRPDHNNGRQPGGLYKRQEVIERWKTLT